MTTRRTDFTSGAAGRGVRARGGDLLAGGVIGDGRYRLLAPFGVDVRGNAHFWRARDGQLRRDVALTVLVGDPTDRNATVGARRTLERAAHAARFMNPAVSRVIDVLGVGSGVDPSEGVLGVVVADWAQGTDLTDLTAEHPLPAATAARLLEPLAIAVDQAHHTGLVLGVDHPQRVRIGPDGELRLAFPGPLPQATLQDDVRGLGAVLYLLLTGRWPLPGGPPSIPLAPLDPTGAPVSPALLRPGVPDELGELAVRSIAHNAMGGIRTSSAVLRLLESVAQRVAVEQETDLLNPVMADGSRSADEDTIWTTRRPAKDDGRRRKLAIGVTALTVATVGVLAWVGMQLISFFGSDTVPVAQTVATAPQTPAPNPTDQPQANPPPAPKPGAPVKPVKAVVYAVKGDKDNARNVNRIMDGNPKTSWNTVNYRKQFPSVKPGIGVLASFDQAEKMAAVAIDSPSEGTVVEIRSAPSATAKFEETKVIGTATLVNGRTEIPVAGTEPAQHILVWITKLGGSGTENASQLREIEFQRAQ